MNRHEELWIWIVSFCYEGKVQEITVREEESGGVEEEREWKGVEEDIQAEGKREGKDVKEDREEPGSWGEKVANSIEQ